MSKKQEKKKSFRDFQEDFVILLEEGFRTAGRITKREFDRATETIKTKLETKYGKEKVEDFSNRVKASSRNANAARSGRVLPEREANRGSIS